MEKSKYYVVRDKALPEVLQKVAEAKQLLDKNRSMTVQEATERLGLSRSSFYKYKDDIAPFSDNTRGKTVTLVIQMEDEPGLLSDLLHVVSDYRANILTIHQTIPVNGIATVTLSVEVRDNTGDMSGLRRHQSRSGPAGRPSGLKLPVPSPGALLRPGGPGLCGFLCHILENKRSQVPAVLKRCLCTCGTWDHCR